MNINTHVKVVGLSWVNSFNQLVIVKPFSTRWQHDKVGFRLIYEKDNKFCT